MFIFISGLYNDLLEQEKPFDQQAYELLNTFIGRLCPPICFVAHNGIRFDYPILLSELNRIGRVMKFFFTFNETEYIFFNCDRLNLFKFSLFFRIYQRVFYASIR